MSTFIAGFVLFLMGSILFGNTRLSYYFATSQKSTEEYLQHASARAGNISRYFGSFIASLSVAIQFIGSTRSASLASFVVSMFWLLMTCYVIFLSWNFGHNIDKVPLGT